jgi:hypothetical protein
MSVASVNNARRVSSTRDLLGDLPDGECGRWQSHDPRSLQNSLEPILPEPRRTNRAGRRLPRRSRLVPSPFWRMSREAPRHGPASGAPSRGTGGATRSRAWTPCSKIARTNIRSQAGRSGPRADRPHLITPLVTACPTTRSVATTGDPNTSGTGPVSSILSTVDDGVVATLGDAHSAASWYTVVSVPISDLGDAPGVRRFVASRLTPPM